METKYKWTVNKLTVAEDNLVVQVDLTVTGVSNGITTVASCTRGLLRGDSFIPYEQLTEQQVLDWCFEPIVNTWKDIDGVEQSKTRFIKDEGEAQVTGQITRQLAQTKSEPALPWA
jgi:hypothetical protein